MIGQPHYNPCADWTAPHGSDRTKPLASAGGFLNMPEWKEREAADAPKNCSPKVARTMNEKRSLLPDSSNEDVVPGLVLAAAIAREMMHDDSLSSDAALALIALAKELERRANSKIQAPPQGSATFPS